MRDYRSCRVCLKKCDCESNRSIRQLMSPTTSQNMSLLDGALAMKCAEFQIDKHQNVLDHVCEVPIVWCRECGVLMSSCGRVPDVLYRCYQCGLTVTLENVLAARSKA